VEGSVLVLSSVVLVGLVVLVVLVMTVVLEPLAILSARAEAGRDHRDWIRTPSLPTKRSV
jgi:hypothetical protein